MKQIVSLIVALALLTLPALAEEGAFSIPQESGTFSMETAFSVLRLAGPQTADAARALFEGMGFSVLRQENYAKDVSDHSDTSAFTVAAGTARIRGEARTLVVISVRGTADGEWYSNFDFAGEMGGDCQYAENFMAAARAIFDAAKPDIDAYDNPVVLATGYSRGAACANLLGVLLDEAYGPEDVYVYTFATPNTVRTADAEYPNIFNLVNMNDAVTRMPLSAWGFRRAGVDVELRDPDFVNADMHEMFLALLGVCPDISAYYNDRHSLAAPGLSDDGITFYELFQAVADTFTNGTPSAETQTLFQQIMTSQNDMTAFFSLFMGTSDSSFFDQHMPAVYTKLMGEYGGE
jgi:hypothetical protein